MIRRDFLKLVATTVAGAPFINTAGASDVLGMTLPTRPLGKTGERITAFTLGGAHLYRGAGDIINQAIIEKAIEVGIRSFDTALYYDEGHAEKIYGKFLTPKYRDQVFLTSKTMAKTGKALRQDLETSLKSLKTDRIDLFQMHAISGVNDVHSRWEQGVVDELLKARDEGLVRYIGFTGHTNPKGHLEMIRTLRKNGVAFDSCLLPINAADSHYESFIINVLPELVKDDYAIFAMKTLAGGGLIGKSRIGLRILGLPEEDVYPTVLDKGLTVRDLHHFVYALPITSVVCGCESPVEVAVNIRNLHAYDGLSEERRKAILSVTGAIAETDAENVEYYKRRIT